MHRRQFNAATTGLALWVAWSEVRAWSLSDADASAGLKEALSRGAASASVGAVDAPVGRLIEPLV